jgi:hypothetical protein
MPLPDGVHRSIGDGPHDGCVILLDLTHTKKLPDSREAFGNPSSLLQNIHILPQNSVCLFDALVPSIQGIFKHEFLHNNCEVKE